MVEGVRVPICSRGCALRVSLCFCVIVATGILNSLEKFTNGSTFCGARSVFFSGLFILGAPGGLGALVNTVSWQLGDEPLIDVTLKRMMAVIRIMAF